MYTSKFVLNYSVNCQALRGILNFLLCSAVSRAILKPAYQFEILNSDSRTLKKVKINSSKNRKIVTVHCCRTTRAMF